jgi:transposase
MKKSRKYRATDVKNVLVDRVLAASPEGAATAGIDISKFEAWTVMRWRDGSFERPWKARIPSQMDELIAALRRIGQQRPLIVAMESTGTYGDALRVRLTAAGLEVHRVGGKAAHDYAEIFDGVPSQHDGKDAAVIAELSAFGKSSPWPYRPPSKWEAELTYWVDWLDGQQRIQMLWLGRIESLLARHWPEATRLLDLNSATLLKTLAHYGGPAKLAADRKAAERLAGWGRHGLLPSKIEKVIASAAATVGVSAGARETQRIKRCAQLALAARREVQKARRELKALAEQSEVLKRQAKMVGAGTACVLWAVVGDPRDYPCGAAYRKAMGLNLKERSSGKYQGQVKITKRGPSLARRWLYFAAMRTVQKPPARGWYEGKKKRDKDRGKGALIAVMRKLAVALYAVGARGEPFEAWRLYPGSSSARKAVQARTGTRSRKCVLEGIAGQEK